MMKLPPPLREVSSVLAKGKGVEEKREREKKEISFFALFCFLASQTRELHILGVSDLQLRVGHVVLVGKLLEVATDVWVRDLVRFWVQFQILCKGKEK